MLVNGEGFWLRTPEDGFLVSRTYTENWLQQKRPRARQPNREPGAASAGCIPHSCVPRHDPSWHYVEVNEITGTAYD